jgi:hypothetical protein
MAEPNERVTCQCFYAESGVGLIMYKCEVHWKQFGATLRESSALNRQVEDVRELVKSGHTEWAAWNIPQCGCSACEIYRAVFPDLNPLRSLKGIEQGVKP